LLRQSVAEPYTIKPAFQIEGVTAEHPGIDQELQQAIENESRTGGIGTFSEVPGGITTSKYLSYIRNIIVYSIERFSIELPPTGLSPAPYFLWSRVRHPT